MKATNELDEASPARATDSRDANRPAASTAKARSDGLVVLVICDLIDSTALRMEIGDSSANTLGVRTTQRIRESIADRGGEVVVGTGDGAVAVFASISRALDAALRLQIDLRLIDHPHAYRQALRVVVDIGDARWADGNVRGPVYERAAALIGAVGAEVVCTSTARFFAQHVRHIEFEPGPTESSFRCVASVPAS